MLSRRKVRERAVDVSVDYSQSWMNRWMMEIERYRKGGRCRQGG